MTAEVKVLRFWQSRTAGGLMPQRQLQIRFLGRDGPDALDRALKVIGRPAASDSDVESAIELLLDECSDEQLQRYAFLALQVKSANPDYAAFIQSKAHPEANRSPLSTTWFL